MRPGARNTPGEGASVLRGQATGIFDEAPPQLNGQVPEGYEGAKNRRQ